MLIRRTRIRWFSCGSAVEPAFPKTLAIRALVRMADAFGNLTRSHSLSILWSLREGGRKCWRRFVEATKF